MSGDTASRPFDFETRQVHAGEVIDREVGARITPIYQTAGYQFEGFDDGEARFAGRSVGRAYSRSENPTNAVAARRLADLEGGQDAILVGSGQAAIATTLFSLAAAGDHVLATERLYEGTRDLFGSGLKRQGIEVEYLPEDASADEWAARVRPTTRALYTETVPNPLNEIPDLERLAGIAHAHGLPFVVDSTVATPYLCRPIEWGADIVIHSTSKWLAGHGAVIGGAIIDAGTFDWAGNAERFPHLTQQPRPGVASPVERFGATAFLGYVRSVTVLDFGPTVPPSSTFLLLHGIETLSLRMERHVANSQTVAEALQGHPAVTHVHYPGLVGDRFHDRAAKYLPLGAGAIVSFELAGGRDAARTFIDSLGLISPMTHIGDVRSLALHTGSTIHGKLTEEARLELGVTPGLVRLSIGIESARDLVADVLQALDRV